MADEEEVLDASARDDSNFTGIDMRGNTVEISAVRSTLACKI